LKHNESVVRLTKGRNFCYALGDRVDKCVIGYGVYRVIVQSVFITDNKFSIKSEMLNFEEKPEFSVHFEDMLRKS